MAQSSDAVDGSGIGHSSPSWMHEFPGTSHSQLASFFTVVPPLHLVRRFVRLNGGTAWK